MGTASKSLALVLAVIFMSFLVTIRPITLKAQQVDYLNQINTITIASDGTISPSDVPIQRNGDIYTLTGDIALNIGGSQSTLTILKSDIIFDGASHKLQGQGIQGSIGIDISDVKNITIHNFIIDNFAEGIHLERCTNSKIVQNTIRMYSINGDLENGISATSLSNFTISGNCISSTADLGTEGTNGLFLRNCINSTVSNNRLQGNWACIRVEGTSNSTFMDNDITQSIIGVMLVLNSDNNFLEHNQVYATVEVLDKGGRSPHANSGTGLLLSHAHNNQFYQNNITSNGDGVQLWADSLGQNSGNTFWRNNFLNNSRQVGLISQSGMTNFWDNGTVGNYWSDYQSKYSNATEIDDSGIGNSSYVIDENNTDHYPLWQADINEIMPTPIPTNSTPTDSPTTGVLTQSLTIPIFAITVVILAFVISVLFYRRHRKSKANGDNT